MVKTDSDEDARDFNGSKLLINEKEITPSTVVSVSDVKPVGAKVVFMLEDVRKRLPIEVQFIDKDFEVPHDVYKQSQIRRCFFRYSKTSFTHFFTNYFIAVGSMRRKI